MDSVSRFNSAREFLLAHRDDYDAAYAGFQWPELKDFNWALDYFDAHARDNERLALLIVDEGKAEHRRSFAQLAERSNQAANFLRYHGVKRGDRILVMLPNIVELWEITLAAMKLGAVLSPASTLLSREDLADRVVRGEMRHVITQAEGTDQFAGIDARVTRIVVGSTAQGWIDYGGVGDAAKTFVPNGVTRAQDPLLLYFTSGTTAKPKMVLHTHQSYPVGHLSTMYWIGLKPNDLHLNISSPGWAKHAWSCLFAPWNAGAAVFIHNNTRFDAAATLRALERYKVTTLCAPPTAWRSLILEDLNKYSLALRELASAGEPLNPEVIERVKAAWGLTIREGFGQTESTAILGYPPGQSVRYGSMGKPLPGYRVDLLDPDGKPAAEGEVSVSLAPRPTGLLAGYVGDEERTQRALSGTHYGTGDVATCDADGYFWFVGRTDDVFKSSDYRISPFELESALIEHHTVAEAAVVESPDPRRLCVPKAFIVLRPGITPDRSAALAIFEFCRERLAPYQRIRSVEFAELPKTVSGKIRRAELRRVEAERRSAAQRGALEFREEDFAELASGNRS